MELLIICLTILLGLGIVSWKGCHIHIHYHNPSSPALPEELLQMLSEKIEESEEKLPTYQDMVDALTKEDIDEL